MLAPVSSDPMVRYAQAWRKLQRAELKAYRATMAARTALWFHQAMPACRDSRSRYILAHGAMIARTRQLARIRRNFELTAESTALELKARTERKEARHMDRITRRRPSSAELYPETCRIDHFDHEWTLETNSQEVAATANHLSDRARQIMQEEDIHGLYVLLDSSGADYAAIYGFTGTVAYTWKTAIRLYPEPDEL